MHSAFLQLIVHGQLLWTERERWGEDGGMEGNKNGTLTAKEKGGLGDTEWIKYLLGLCR